MNPDLFPAWDIASCWWLPLAACLLDRLVGDPPGWPHPVRLIGAWLRGIERPLRRLPPFMGGLAGLLLTLGATGLVAVLLTALPGLAGYGAALYLSFAGLALGQLVREGARARTLLDAGDLAGARRAVGRLVSRDVSGAGADELGRVLAESLSENFNDGFTAPLFWLVLGGPVGLWLYKAVSTMDSMWGYPFAPWTLFGRAAARADDVLAFVPARLSAFFLWLAGGAMGFSRRAGRSWPGYAVFRAQALSMKSPNAGWPMAMAAWLHGRALGGPAIYNGAVVEKPRLGPDGGVWRGADIARLLRHLQLAALIGLLGLEIPAVCLARLFFPD
jgi:adenosylcobinamide-phosphate synthase